MEVTRLLQIRVHDYHRMSPFDLCKKKRAQTLRMWTIKILVGVVGSVSYKNLMIRLQLNMCNRTFHRGQFDM